MVDNLKFKMTITTVSEQTGEIFNETWYILADWYFYTNKLFKPKILNISEALIDFIQFKNTISKAKLIKLRMEREGVYNYELL